MQQFQLTIPEPCHESWQQMTPTQQGRFCNACAKEVIDFSTMSDHEVLNYFNNLKHDNVCGRALPSQLERTIALPNEPAKKRFWYWNYITLFFLLFSKNSTAHKPHGGIAFTKFNLNTLKDFTFDLTTRKSSKQKIWVSKIIHGKITDENGRGIAAATIAVKGTDRNVQSDSKGVYTIKVNPATEMLEISAGGYSKTIFVLSGLSNYDFTLSASARDIIIFAGKMIKRPESPKKQERYAPVTITGNIINQKGDVIPFASVKVFNSQTGIIADSAGKFTITVNDINNKIEVSAVGYKSKIIEASSKEILENIILENAFSITMQPLVVVGYQQTNTGLVCRVGGVSVRRKSSRQSLPDTLKQVFNFKKNSVKIYPSPVTRGSAFSVTVSSKQTGEHSIQIIDVQGRVVLKQQVQINAKEQTVQLQSSNNWSAGIYFIRVFNTNNSLLSTNSFSVQ
ncbi:MAG: carboxypeptidase-like regulatory domain-containing protein [Ferruginibacter sp.]